MAQLVISAVGAAAGFMIGGPVGMSIGWSLGSMLASSMAPAQKVQGAQQQLMDLRVSGTEYGQPIPYVCGSALMAGQIWWNTDRRPTTTTTTTSSGGGKGGGGGVETSTSTITYDMDMLIGLSDNPIIGIARIWNNGALIYTATDTASDASLAASAISTAWRRLTVYQGSDTQLPDPTYEAAVGLGNAPAYRGRGMVFIEGLQLGQGGQVPNLTFEVVAAGMMYGSLFASFDPEKHPVGRSTISGWPYGPAPDWVKTNCTLYVQDAWVTYEWWSAAPNLFRSSGKYYCEFALFDNPGGIGICNENWNPADWSGNGILGANADSYGFFPVWGGGYYGGAYKNHNGVSAYYSGYTYLQGCRASLLLDLDGGTLSVWINGHDQGVAYTGITGSWGPAGMVQNWKYGSGCTLVTDPLHFAFAPPPGYGPWMRGPPTVVKGPPSVATVVAQLCDRAGLQPNQIDISALSSITRKARSLAISQITTTRATLELLMSAYFFEMTVSDKIHFRPRGGDAVATIPYLDLGATAGRDQAEPLELTEQNELEIPAQIALTYINLADDYQNDTQYSDRLISANAGSVSAVQMTLGMTPDEAKLVADAMIHDQSASVFSTKIALLGDYCRLEPTDTVTVLDHDGSPFRLRLVKKTDAYPLLQFDAVVDDISVLTSQALTSADYASSDVVAAAASTVMKLLDVPILRDEDNDAGFYVATKGDSPSYPGSSVFSSVDDVEYTRRATVTESAVFGTCTTTLGDWTLGRVFDEQNSVTVDVGAGSLASTTRDALLHDLAVNAMLIGEELIQFRTATLVSAGIYTLCGLLRGGRGTEWAMTGHVASERCVLLRAQGLRRIAMLTSDIGLSRFYKGVTLSRTLSSALPKSFVDTGVGLKPFAPILVRKARDATNTLILDWQRRSRFAVRMIGALGISVPLGEASEKYEIDIFDAPFTTLLDSISSTVPSLRFVNGVIPAPDSGRFTLSVSPVSVKMQSYHEINLWWRFFWSGSEWASAWCSQLGLTVVYADGTAIQKFPTDPDKWYYIGRVTDPFNRKTTPTAGWEPLMDGSPLSSDPMASDAYYTQIRDHRDSPNDVIATTGRTARLTFAPPGGGLRGIYFWGTGFILYDKSTLPGATELGVTRTPCKEFFSAAESNFDTLAGGTTFAYAGTTWSARNPIDSIVLGNLIYTLIWGPNHTFSSAGKSVDITNLLNADLTFASTTQIMTIRHSISGGVITPLDERAGRYHADRINSTQAIEWGANQVSLVDLATGAISGTTACAFDIVAVAGDWAIGDVWYSIDAAATLRKHHPDGSVIATLTTGVPSYPYSGSPPTQEAGIWVSASNVYFRTPSATSIGGGYYMADKNLSGFSTIAEGSLITGASEIPWDARPDSDEVVVLIPTLKGFGIAGSGSIVTLPSSVGVKVYQISEAVGRGYPLTVVI